MLGKVNVILHRSIPDGFKIKTVSITKKADGYYLTLSLEDSTVPEVKPDFDSNKSTGIDVGLKNFLTTSEGRLWQSLNITAKLKNACELFRSESRAAKKAATGDRKQLRNWVNVIRK